MKVKICISIIIIMLLATITVYATDEMYVWSNQADSIATTSIEPKTDNFLRVNKWFRYIN